MKTGKLVATAAKEFYNDINIDDHGRYRSWEYCFYAFYRARSDKNADSDYLSLQLAFYLASWGMYRGSSFLLQKDYKIHIPVVEEILKSKYDPLFNVTCEQLLDDHVQNLLSELIQFLTDHYQCVRASVKGTDIKNAVSETLITKTLLGTLGCVPAYDRYFIAGIKRSKTASSIFSVKSIVQLAQFYQENQFVLEQVRQEMKLHEIVYPQMKVIDMGFWQIGEELESYKL